MFQKILTINTSISNLAVNIINFRIELMMSNIFITLGHFKESLKFMINKKLQNNS